jgi:UDP-N-acetylmuramyl pentapeptide phosphotransferase/UDP-N-acetylglucosamine-1-phosphate transferase
MVFAAFVIVGAVNAVNITDGLDGLATTVTVPVALFFVSVATWWGYTQLGIFAGALLWWFGLTYIIDKVRTKFQVSTICLINRIIGSIVIVAGFIGFLWALLPHFGINI